MDLHRIFENCYSLDWKIKTMIGGILAALPFVVTFAVTSIESKNCMRSKARAIEVPPLPYAIPLLGNLFAFVSDTLGIFKSISRDYSSKSVRLRLGTETVYLVSGAQNIKAVFSRSRDLSTKLMLLKILKTAFVMPSSDSRIYEYDDSGMYHKPAPGSEVPPDMRIFHNSHRLFNQELTGQSLAELSRQFLRIFAMRLRKKGEEFGNEWVELPDIFGFVRDEAFIATTEALCGEHLLRLSPGFAEDFWLFDVWLPTLVKLLPRWLIPRGFTVRDNALHSIMKWHEFSDKHFDCVGAFPDDVLWEPVYGHKLMRARANMYRPTGIYPEGRAANDLGMIWGANANVIPSASWALIHILADGSLTTRVREEIAPAFLTKDVKSVDMVKLNNCPLLQSVIAEVLRLNVAVMINRTSTIPDFTFEMWFVKPGRIMLASVYVAHRNESVWNTGRTLPNGKAEHPLGDFWAERFLEYPNDPFSGPTTKHVSAGNAFLEGSPIVRKDKEAKFTTEGLKGVYFPFGGGVHMCPGRHYAKNEMVLAVVMLFWAFDVEFLDPERAKKTNRSMSAFGVGTLTPDRKNPIRLRKRS